MKQEPISFPNQQDHLLSGEYINNGKDWAVIVAHGFPSSATGSTVTNLRNALGARLYNVLTFDFHGSGRSEGDFQQKLMSKEVDDLESAIDFLEEEKQIERVVLMGHSTGAIDVALYDPSDHRVAAKVLLGGVADLTTAVNYDFTPLQIKDFWEKGEIQYLREGEWYHEKKLNKAFYDEFFTLSIAKSLSEYYKPLLIAHGTEDFLNYKQEALPLYAMANEPREIFLQEGADHKFSNPAHFNNLVRRLEEFFARWM